VLSKRHSENLWRSTKELGNLFRTWWRAKRGTQPSWRGLGPQWNRDKTWKERRRAEITWWGLRMALGKFRGKELHRLPPVRLVALFFLV